MKLSELRKKSNLTQSQLAKILRVPAPKVSLYESGFELPILEKMAILNRHFNCKIVWPETVSESEKADFIISLKMLLTVYPAERVLEYCQRMFRRHPDPVKEINRFTAAALSSGHESLYQSEYDNINVK
ncbi:MAG: helix-turn-helix transcriptional regulator [Ignavibacteria bacterium]|nr:helix-turn-helix transcriptional regulator [Ignavibacteria bacterium]